MVLNWFDAREAEAFGIRLAEFCDQKFHEIERAGARKQEEKRGRLLAQMLQLVRQFGATHRLNIYKKAQLANKFKWHMKDLGHDPELIEMLTREILLALR